MSEEKNNGNLEKVIPSNLVSDVVVAPSTNMDIVFSAMEKGFAMEMIEKVIKIQYDQEDRNARKAFYAALSKFQSAIPVIEKTGKASFPTKGGGKMSYEFAKIEDIAKAIKPFLAPNGLSYRFDGKQNNGIIQITCIVTHVDGYEVESSMSAGSDGSGNKSEIQRIASTRTYLKRYTMTEAMGIIVGGEDDDAAPPVKDFSQSDFFPDDKFSIQFPKWEKKILAGEKTAKEMVKFQNDKGIKFTDPQLDCLYGVSK
jgi:hypothetical protein